MKQYFEDQNMINEIFGGVDILPGAGVIPNPKENITDLLAWAWRVANQIISIGGDLRESESMKEKIRTVARENGISDGVFMGEVNPIPSNIPLGNHPCQTSSQCDQNKDPLQATGIAILPAGEIR